MPVMNKSDIKIAEILETENEIFRKKMKDYVENMDKEKFASNTHRQNYKEISKFIENNYFYILENTHGIYLEQKEKERIMDKFTTGLEDAAKALQQNLSSAHKTASGTTGY